MIWRCDLLPQYEKYKEEIDAAIKRVLNSGRYTLAEEVHSFEEEYAAYLGVKYVVSVANATDGLTLSLKALDIGKGDEVITTAFTAIPTISAIIDAGATPVFADINPNTYLVSIDEICKKINKKTRATMPVHIFGNVVDIPRLISNCVGIPVIEDAAQAHGSSIDGKKAGTMGIMGVYSFYPTKNLGAYGDGGAIATNDEGLAKKLRLLRMYGMIDKDHIVINGRNSRLDEMQAAILRVKLKYLDEMNLIRNGIANVYKDRLEKNFSHQLIKPNVFSNYHVFNSRYLGNRDKLVEYLEQAGIQANVYYLLPHHLQEALKELGYQHGDLPNVEKVCSQAVALPFYPEIKEEVIKLVIDTIARFEREQS